LIQLICVCVCLLFYIIYATYITREHKTKLFKINNAILEIKSLGFGVCNNPLLFLTAVIFERPSNKFCPFQMPETRAPKPKVKLNELKF
jgi:hypothetical protein